MFVVGTIRHDCMPITNWRNLVSNDPLEGYRSKTRIVRLRSHAVKKSDDDLELDVLLLSIRHGADEQPYDETLRLRVDELQLHRLCQSIRDFLD